MPEKWLNPAYATDSPDWEVLYAFEHEDQGRRGVRDARAGTPPPLVVRDEDQKAEAAYPEALTAALCESDEEKWRKGGCGGLPGAACGGHDALHYR
ncbi:hypothetical protein D1007_27241 [Hordeum vulgare]|nr:hypothetical protein D1007_27241 [Hordeum vulgare]